MKIDVEPELKDVRKHVGWYPRCSKTFVAWVNRATLTLKESKDMFKLFFVDLVSVSSGISLSILMDNKEPPRLNKITVRMYHKLFVRKGV